MTELTLTETNVYQENGFYWLLSGETLVQFSDGFYNRWKPGSEMYYYKIRDLKKLKPIGNSDGIWILENLIPELKQLRKKLKNNF